MINILNEIKLNENVIFNKNLLNEIIDENIDAKIDDVSDIELSDKIIKTSNNLRLKNLIDEILYADNPDKSDYSIYDLFELFDEISDAIRFKKLSDKRFNIKFNEFLTIFENTIYDILNKILKIDPDDYIIKFDISRTNIISNNHVFLSDDLLNDSIYGLLEYDYDENIDEYADYLDDVEFEYDYDINHYEYYEILLTEMYNNQYNTNIDIKHNLKNYSYQIKRHDEIIDIISDVDLLKISINDYFKLLKIYDDELSDADIRINKFDIDLRLSSIDDLFEIVNNSIESGDFIYDLLENEYELLYDEFYDKFYYEIDDIKFISIYDLKRYVLNRFINLNLNLSFKFNDNIYNIF